MNGRGIYKRKKIGGFRSSPLRQSDKVLVVEGEMVKVGVKRYEEGLIEGPKFPRQHPVGRYPS